MNVFEHWLPQREKLLVLLNHQQKDTADCIYQVRHALSQTEQNALAEIQDDVLRQQAGILFGCIKNSIHLLEVQTSAQIWVPRKPMPKASFKAWLPSLCFLILAVVYCVFQALWLPMLLVFGGLLLGCSVRIHEQKKHAPDEITEDRLLATVELNADKLLALMDGQLHAIDRYLNDFRYLNELLKGSSDCTDPAAISHASELLEALYECDSDEREAAEEASKQLLESLGLKALDYSEENSRYFNALPSKNTTRTLSPAIFSIKDHRLLRRGTAAVKIDAA